MRRMSNRLPVGPGSRGGQWHDPEFRKAYYRWWRLGHPDYRERERRRRLLLHAMSRLTRFIEGSEHVGAHRRRDER